MIADLAPGLKLDLYPYAQRLRRRDGPRGKAELWCLVRRRWVISQPEELVRQALVAHLTEAGYATGLMQVERKVGPGGRRLDLLLLTPGGAPYVLAEAKAPGYSLQPAIAQLADYNRHWRARYALAVNGQDALCYALDYASESVGALAGLPPPPTT